jgi:hypothetical protein
MNGDGVGLAAAQTGADIGVAPLVRDAFGPAVKVGSGSTPLVAGAESRDLAVVWKTPSGWVGRHAAKDQLLEPEAPLGVMSDAAGLSSDRSGDMVLGGGVDGSVVTAVWDEPPGAARLRTNRAYKRLRRPLLRWGMGLDLWGGQTFRVIVDGAVVGTTTKESLTSPPLKDGAHKWQVLSVDARGQETPSKPRYVRVDRTPPTITLRKRSGRRLRVILRDRLAGVHSARTDFGDGTVTRLLGPGEHRYTRAGSYRVTVRAEDAAGNVANKRFTVRVG